MIRTASILLSWVAALVLGAAVPGCGSADAGAHTNGNGGAGGGTSNPDLKLTFSVASVFLVSGERRQLTLEALPPARRTVRLSLVGDIRDAFLDESEIVTDDEGTGTVWLTAPTKPATFIVRASLEEGPHAELTASTGEGFGDVRVIPEYEGLRTVTTWTATVRTGSTCAMYTEIPAPDGQLVSDDVAPNEFPTIESAPAGAPLTVTVRAGHFAGGCVDIEGIVADEVNIVPIQVADRPLQMGAAEFDVRLGVNDNVEWRVAFEPVIDAMLASMLDGAPSDVTRLLDVMGEVIGASNLDAADDFEASRLTKDWDAELTSLLGDAAIDGIRQAARSRLAGGLDRFVEPDNIDFISGALTASSTAWEVATLDISEVGGVHPAIAGFPTSVATTWIAGGFDTVRIGAELTWAPTMLLTALADAEAGTAEDAAIGIAEEFGCSAIAEQLASLGSTPGLAYATCDAACVEASCYSAVRALWELGRNARPSEGTLEIAPYGDVRIDDEAVPTGFTGAWVGTGMVTATQEVRFEGPAEGGDAPAQ